jgi:predicted MPP superfamily phosphohydrolase
MNNYKHLKKNKIVMQFSDGSSISLFCSIKKKELLTEVDIKSSIFWRNDLTTDKGVNNKDKTLNNFKKLFLKLK